MNRCSAEIDYEAKLAVSLSALRLLVRKLANH